MSTLPSAIKKTFQLGQETVVLETGRLARQADGAVLVTIGKTQVLTTVVGVKEVKSDQDFFPLSVHYIEKSYAAGRIPGGYLKREGRPSEKETLTSRLIDRPIRPLFPKGFMQEVQVICMVMSADINVDPDIAALIGTSAALSISGIPFAGPIGAVRVGFNEESGYILNPTYSQLSTSLLDMVVAGTKDAVLMVESEAQELTEDDMLGAVLFAHQESQAIISAISEFSSEVGKPIWDWTAPVEESALCSKIESLCGQSLSDAYAIADKTERYKAIHASKEALLETLSATDDDVSLKEASKLFSNLQKRIVRENIISGKPRIDGRDNDTVRPLTIEVGCLESVHGSSVFTRGETQAVVTTTLGSVKDAKFTEFLHGKDEDPFMFHYNFPPYSVGEAGRMGGIGRREIGHGRLARRGVQAMMPTLEDFSYTIRVVSEITESNGSSSMASVCGASLSLMDAGVPLKSPVAGIAMGLIKENEQFAVLTDILGDEDHLGDMDFKVAGSKEGITALQMDIKIEGITEEIMEVALQKALVARLHILEQMNQVLSASRVELPDSAPTLLSIKIDSDKIRDVIGKGGVTIRGISDETGADVDINDNGEVKVFATTKAAAEAAKTMIETIVADVEVDTIYDGVVVKIVDFGAFVNILPGKDGLVHVSQIAEERVENIADYLEEGQKVRVNVLDVDNRGRIKLSMKGID